MLALRFLWVNWYYRKHRHVWENLLAKEQRVCYTCGRRESTEIEYGR